MIKMTLNPMQHSDITQPMWSRLQPASRALRWLLLLGLLLGLPGAAAAQPPMGLRAHTWTLTPTGAPYLSSPLQAPFAFTALAAHWQAELPQGGALTVEARLSRDGAHWEPWQPFREPELQAGEWYAENLVLLDAARWAQFRITAEGAATVTQIALVAIDASNAPTLAAARAQAAPPLAAPTGAPTPGIIPRSAWGADETLMTWPPEYAAVQKIVVHHTVTSGGDNPLAELQAIYYYHAVVRGWGDIGYNYLIDKFGNVYEGRYGGPDVIGGHTYGYNTGSVGIGNLGDYSAQPPSAAMLAANAQLAAWIANCSYFHPEGSDFFKDMTTPNIAGHREYAATACPGDALNAQLPAIRAQAWQSILAHNPVYAAAYLSHTTPPVMLAGDTVTVSHLLRNTGTNTWYRVADPLHGTPYHLGYHWYDAEGAQYVQPPEEDHRASLPTDAPFAAQPALAALLTAPRAPGQYTLRWDMVHELVAWFDSPASPALNVSVAVTYPVTLTGRVFDNRGAAVETWVALNGSDAVTQTGSLYAFERRLPGSYLLQAHEPGPYHFPNGEPRRANLSGGESLACDFVLAPFDNALVNSGFEHGLTGWQSANAQAVAEAHTGDGGAALTVQSAQTARLSQTLRLPTGALSPTLTLLYRGGAETALTLAIETPQGTFTQPLAPASDWTHAWVAVNAGGGDPVTVTLELIGQTGSPTIAVWLDEITLGSAGAAGWRYTRAYLPLVLLAAEPWPQ